MVELGRKKNNKTNNTTDRVEDHWPKRWPDHVLPASLWTMIKSLQIRNSNRWATYFALGILVWRTQIKKNWAITLSQQKEPSIKRLVSFFSPQVDTFSSLTLLSFWLLETASSGSRQLVLHQRPPSLALFPSLAINKVPLCLGVACWCGIPLALDPAARHLCPLTCARLIVTVVCTVGASCLFCVFENVL